jgi:hypothetical protein
MTTIYFGKKLSFLYEKSQISGKYLKKKKSIVFQHLKISRTVENMIMLTAPLIVLTIRCP